MKRPAIFYPHIAEFGGIEQNIKSLAEFSGGQGMPVDLVCYYDRVGMQSNHLCVSELGDHWNPLVKARRCRQWMRRHEDSLVGLPLYFGTKAGFYGALGATPAGRGYAFHYTDPPSLQGQSVKQLRSCVKRLRSRIADRIMSRGVAIADKTLTMTQKNADELLSIYGYPFDIIYQGGKAPPSDVADASQEGAHHWLSVCRLAASKHLDWIIAAAEAFCQRHGGPGNSGLTVTIAGLGPCRGELEQLVRDLNLASVVKLPGFLSEKELENEFSRTTLFLTPARQGYGLPVLEALYRRTPVVLSQESRISEILWRNPWACVSAHDKSTFVESVNRFVDELARTGRPPEHHLHGLPTEAGWAEEIGRACGWWNEVQQDAKG